MSNPEDNAGSTSTTSTIPDEVEERVTKWPTVIGVISLIYALGGLLCQLFIGGWTFFSHVIPEQFRGGMTFPPIMKAIGAVQLVILLVLGIIMLTGAVALLRRQRKGVARLKVWAVARIVMIALGVVISVLTAQAQIQMQRDALEWQRDFFKEHNISQEVPDLTDQQIWKRILISLAVISAIWSAYPLFLGLYLSSRKVSNQVEQWP